MLRCARYSAINTWKWWRKSGASVSRIPALCYLAFVMDRAPEIRNNKRPSSNDRKRYAIAVGKIGSMCDSFFFFFYCGLYCASIDPYLAENHTRVYI